MDKIKQLQVYYEGRTVGTMALYRKHLAAFQYSEEWIADGFSISPFSLPLGKKVFVPQILPFDGIFGVFEDSLRDRNGRNQIVPVRNMQRLFRNKAIRSSP